MGEIKKPEKVKLICGILISRLLYEKYFSRVTSILTSHFGEIDYQSDLIDFTFTNYYKDEIGREVYRIFVSFKKLIEKEDISSIKVLTNEIEESFSYKVLNLKRPLNLDPGYMELSKLVLASTKNFYHRIYLRNGIYGEVTLYYSKKMWNDLPWTFPDYRSKEYKRILTEIRNIYKKQIGGNE